MDFCLLCFINKRYSIILVHCFVFSDLVKSLHYNIYLQISCGFLAGNYVIS